MTREDLAWSYVESRPTCGTVLDIDYGPDIQATPCKATACVPGVVRTSPDGDAEDAGEVGVAVAPSVVARSGVGSSPTPPSILLAEQKRRLDDLLAAGPDALCDMVVTYWPLIRDMARRRLVAGHESYGSTMYGWDDATRLRNVLEELADAPVYMSSEPRENSA